MKYKTREFQAELPVMLMALLVDAGSYPYLLVQASTALLHLVEIAFLFTPSFATPFEPARPDIEPKTGSVTPFRGILYEYYHSMCSIGRNARGCRNPVSVRGRRRLVVLSACRRIRASAR